MDDGNDVMPDMSFESNVDKLCGIFQDLTSGVKNTTYSIPIGGDLVQKLSSLKDEIQKIDCEYLKSQSALSNYRTDLPLRDAIDLLSVSIGIAHGDYCYSVIECLCKCSWINGELKGKAITDERVITIEKLCSEYTASKSKAVYPFVEVIDDLFGKVAHLLLSPLNAKTASGQREKLVRCGIPVQKISRCVVGRQTIFVSSVAVVLSSVIFGVCFQTSSKQLRDLAISGGIAITVTAFVFTMACFVKNLCVLNGDNLALTTMVEHNSLVGETKDNSSRM